VEIVRERYVEARDGTRLFFTDRGEGPAIVLLDGLSCDGFIWRYLEPHFAQTHRIVHPHHRGHGRSATPLDVNARIEDLVDDLEVVRREAGLRNLVIMGHSMGVQVALEYTRRRPSRVVGLVGICGSHGRVLSTFQNTDRIALLLPIMRRAYENNPERLRWLWENFPVRFTYQMALATRQVNPVLVHRPDVYIYLRHIRRVDIGLFLSLVKSLHEHDASTYMHTLGAPALVIAGEYDTFTPPSVAERMASAVPDSEYLLVRGGTHSAAIEMPELTNLAIERFLFRIGWI
jgi:pimeloyl-ACP methyl ester carboxylesterase